MPNAWDHLPNAKLIDWVIADVKNNPGAWNAASDAARDAAWVAAWVAARDAAWNAAWNAAWVAAWNAAWGAVAALVAYDDCAKYLDMTPDELQVWGELSGDPACALLIPVVIRKA